MFLFLTEIPILRRNLVYPINKWIHIYPSRWCLLHFFTFKTFKECLPHFHSSQFSLCHHGYKCFSIHLSYFDEKTEIVSFFGKNLSMSDLNTILYHYKWPHNDVTAICTYHFDNGIVLSTSNFISTNSFSAFYTLTWRFSNGVPLVNHLYRKVN